MSIFNPPGYLAHPRQSLGAELIGFNPKTGQPVQAAAGLGCGCSGVGSPDGLGSWAGWKGHVKGAPGRSVGSYLDLSTDYYKTFQHDNWQHPGSEGWSSANMPGWGNNPNLQMGPRRGVGNATGDIGKGGLVFLALLAVGLFVGLTNDKGEKPAPKSTKRVSVYG